MLAPGPVQLLEPLQSPSYSSRGEGACGRERRPVNIAQSREEQV